MRYATAFGECPLRVCRRRVAEVVITAQHEIREIQEETRDNATLEHKKTQVVGGV